MRHRCWFTSGVARIGFDARISGNTPAARRGFRGLDDLTRARWGMPRVAELWEPT